MIMMKLRVQFLPKGTQYCVKTNFCMLYHVLYMVSNNYNEHMTLHPYHNKIADSNNNIKKKVVSMEEKQQFKQAKQTSLASLQTSLALFSGHLTLKHLCLPKC